MRSIALLIPRLPVPRRPALRWITSDIAVSGLLPRDTWAALRREGAGCALDLRTAAEGGGRLAPLPAPATLRWYPIEDGHAPPIRELGDVTDWIVGRIATGSRAVVGCREGRGRSTLLACAALLCLGYPLDGAYRVIRRGQPGTVWSDAQIEVLQEFSRRA